MRKTAAITIGFVAVLILVGYFFFWSDGHLRPYEAYAPATATVDDVQIQAAEPELQFDADTLLSLEEPTASVEIEEFSLSTEIEAPQIQFEAAGAEVTAQASGTAVTNVEAPSTTAAASDQVAPATAEDLSGADAAIAAPGDFVIASHVFAGPGEIPPNGFLAYGVIAFPQRPTPDTEYRYMMLCRAFQDTISFSGDVAQPASRQVVTIWPVVNAEIAAQIRNAPPEERCAMAVRHYHLPHSEHAIEAARVAGQKIGVDRGPFLFAWYPGEWMGRVSVPVLDRDLSLVVTPAQAAAEFRAWKRDIRNHDCWDCANIQQRLRRDLRLYSDYYGTRTIGALRAMLTDMFTQDGSGDA